ncbi:MAG: hypothetical protein ACYDC1_09445 [Limisphaerales bacterium]
MSELVIIETKVEQARSRRRWQRTWRGFWAGLLIGSLIWLVALGLYKLLPLPPLTLAVAGGAFLVSCLIGLIAGGWRAEKPTTAARWLDEREQLKERVSTAWEVSRNPRAGRWGELLVSDAARHLAKVDVRRLLPFQLPRASHWTVLVLALGAGLGFVPEYRSQDYVQKQQEAESIREAGRNLADLSRRSLEKRQPTLEGATAAVKSVGELGRQFEKTPVTRSEALRELAKMTDQVQQQARELPNKPALRAMEKAANAANRNTPASSEELQKQMDAMQRALGNKESTADAMEKLQDALQKARQAAANLNAKGSEASDAAKDSLAKALANLAQQAQDMGAALPSLEEAMAALEAGKIDQMLKDLEVAEKDLDKLKDLAQALQEMQQQAQQLGKDLAEQLKNGQAAAAAETLRKMVNQLKSGQLTPEQMQAILKEVDDAVKPAGDYGKVQEFLQQAKSQLQSGEKPEAAQSLADAAKELENLMEQLADAQDLKGMMDALKRAQACVGTGAGWAKCQGAPGFKPGGKPGRGVGTWAEEGQNFETPPDTGAWDNSDVQRPDMASRGQTERDPSLPDTLTPTKVKGQFTPGGPMPSITLKGVSLKGQSSVGIQEAITTAQSDAQSAISQDQVPRAYQGAVKDYFDDLKK